MRKLFFPIVCILAFMSWSCGNNSEKNSTSEKTVLQQEDGTLSLKMEEATCYNDEYDPSSNTAEWNVKVSKPGRFKVWLSSATKDTTDLSYINSVKISLLDKLLEVNPEPDRVVLNSKDVSYPYYRADSYMGSFYIAEP